MDGMDGHNRDMGAMTPTMNNGSAGGMPMNRHHKMMMHMTFFWGKNTLVLFDGFPGSSIGLYALALVFVFVLSVLVEWLSHSKLIKPGSNHVVAGLIQTILHAIRTGLSYLVMLAVMSFNVGIFLAAIAGHTLGFFFFGSRVFRNSSSHPGKTSDLPPSAC